MNTADPYRRMGLLKASDWQAKWIGHGTVEAPVSPTWNGVQKTHAGPYAGNPGTQVRPAG